MSLACHCCICKAAATLESRLNTLSVGLRHRISENMATIILLSLQSWIRVLMFYLNHSMHRSESPFFSHYVLTRWKCTECHTSALAKHVTGHWTNQANKHRPLNWPTVRYRVTAFCSTLRSVLRRSSGGSLNGKKSRLTQPRPSTFTSHEGQNFTWILSLCCFSTRIFFTLPISLLLASGWWSDAFSWSRPSSLDSCDDASSWSSLFVSNISLYFSTWHHHEFYRTRASRNREWICADVWSVMVTEGMVGGNKVVLLKFCRAQCSCGQLNGEDHKNSQPTRLPKESVSISRSARRICCGVLGIPTPSLSAKKVAPKRAG